MNVYMYPISIPASEFHIFASWTVHLFMEDDGIDVLLQSFLFGN